MCTTTPHWKKKIIHMHVHQKDTTLEYLHGWPRIGAWVKCLVVYDPAKEQTPMYASFRRSPRLWLFMTFETSFTHTRQNKALTLQGDDLEKGYDGHTLRISLTAKIKGTEAIFYSKKTIVILFRRSSTSTTRDSRALAYTSPSCT